MLSATKRVTAFLPRNLQQLRQLHEDIEESIYFYKSRGQHILTNPRVLDTIVQKSAINPSDTVLEIGPGTGNLTLKLLEASREVMAIEIDQRMVNILENRALKRGLHNKLTVTRFYNAFHLFDEMPHTTRDLPRDMLNLSAWILFYVNFLLDWCFFVCTVRL
jgi:protein-L-isoaspartate O-methyltransferase